MAALIIYDDARSAITFADRLIEEEAEKMPERPGVKIGMNCGTAI